MKDSTFFRTAAAFLLALVVFVAVSGGSQEGIVMLSIGAMILTAQSNIVRRLEKFE